VARYLSWTHGDGCTLRMANIPVVMRSGSPLLWYSWESGRLLRLGSRLVAKSVCLLDMGGPRELATVTWLIRRIGCDDAKSLAVDAGSLGSQPLQAL
jgi:hypothetical protein